MLEEIAKLIRRYGRYPVKAEILIEKRGNAAIPAPNVLLRRLGSRAEVIRKVRGYCDAREEYLDVSAILSKESLAGAATVEVDEAQITPKNQSASGYVYLVKSGKLYKIGWSENHWRRKSELHKQAPEGITEIHTIAAIDDPVGIERYWHERFKEKRQHGEWFDLSAEDISAFKKRRFM
ncbi:MAG: GIY-YIG nuclease family protein [Terracidiphilus sp.]